MQRSQKTVLFGSVAAVAFGAASIPLFPFYMTVLGALIVPLLVILALRSGAFCSALAAVLLALVGYSFAGWAGAAAVLMTVPGCVVAVSLLLSRKASIYHATYYGSAVMMAGMIAFWAVYALATGSDLATDLLRNMRETLLALTRAGQSVSMPAYTAELENTVRLLFTQYESQLKMQVLAQMVTLSCLSGLLGAVLPVIYMRRRGLSEQVSAVGRLHTWRIPRKIALALMGTYVGTFLLALMGVPGMLEVSQSAWRAVEIVYGAACLSFLSLTMRNAAMVRGTRNLLLGLVLVGMLVLHLFNFIGSLLFVLAGVFAEARRERMPRAVGGSPGPFGVNPPKPDREEET